MRVRVLAATILGLAWHPLGAQEAVDTRVFQVLAQATMDAESTVAFVSPFENSLVHYDATPLLTLNHVDTFFVQASGDDGRAFLLVRLSEDGRRELERRTVGFRGRQVVTVVEGSVERTMLLKRPYRSTYPILIASGLIDHEEATSRADRLNHQLHMLKQEKDDA